MSTHSLLVGLAGIVNTAALGVYDPSRSWTDADTATAVLLGNQIPQEPTKLIVIGSYRIPTDPILNDSRIGVQFRIRGDADEQTVLDLDDALFNLFQGMRDTTVAGIPVVLVEHKSSLSLGPDQNNRVERTSNFYFWFTEPTLYRTD